MDKQTENMFNRVFDKLDGISTEVSATKAFCKQNTDDIGYVRGRVDTLADVSSSTTAKLDNHISSTGNNPERISAVAAWASVIVAFLCLVATCFIAYASAQ